MPGPLTLDTTVGHDKPQFHTAAADHLNAPNFLWVTTRARRHPHGRQPGWAQLSALTKQPANTRIRLTLPEPATGARGHLTIADTNYELVCVHEEDASPGNPLVTLLDYPYIDPVWILDQPRHIRALLSTLCWSPADAPPGHTPPIVCGHLTTSELAGAVAPFLNLTPDVTETLAAAVKTHPSYQAPPLTQIHALAHALN